LSRIYGAADAPNLVTVGSLASAESIPALVNIDKLVTRHCAVVGTTGAGKSTTVAHLLLSLSDPSRFRSARIMILDIHGEYFAALSDRARVFRVNADEERGENPLYIPYWAMTFDELMTVTFGALGDTERGAVMEKVTELKLNSLREGPRKGVVEDNLTVDTPAPFSIHKLWFDLHRLVHATHTVAGGQSEKTEALLLDDNNTVIQQGDSLKVIPPKYKPHTQASGEEKIYLSSCPFNLRRPLYGLASKLRDPRYDFLFRPGPWYPNEQGLPKEDLDSLLEAWIGGPHAITILDLSGIPTSVLTHLIGVLLRIVFDSLFWARNLSEGGRERPIFIVLEEAHAYLSQGSEGVAARSVRRIVKEGRKYGLGAMVVSQRPSEIDPTILSQCGTIFAMRLVNSTDRAHVTGAVSDNLEGLFSMLPALRVGEAIIVGESVHLPIRTLVDPPTPNRRPDSSDPMIYDENNPGGWNRLRETSNYEDVLEVWRRQDPKSGSIVEK
ncbi:ATP-binding protein, partial [Acidobacteria bacterium AH-259-A15]|nr:ATP-binding protein [Acidobacteria bacterium AH-259-A15]